MMFENSNSEEIRNNFIIQYDQLSNTTDKTYYVNGVKVIETYEGNVSENIFVGDSSIKPIEIRNGETIFLYDTDHFGNDVTIISNVQEWENEGIESKTYHVHINNLDDCKDSDLLKIEYREYGYEKSLYKEIMI